MTYERVGIINIGATAFRMHIAEYYGDNIRELDFMIKPVRLGSDTYSYGYISLDNVKKSVEVLKQFKLKLKEYDVTIFRAFCTSGVREAKNKDFFLDYVQQHSGVKLEFLEPMEEVYIKYICAKNSVKNFDEYEKHGLVFANVATSNMILNVTYKENYIYSGVFPHGTMLLKQMFNHISHLKRHKAIEGFADVMFKNVRSSLPKNQKLSHFVATGSSINLLHKLFDVQGGIIRREQLESTYNFVRTMSMGEIMSELDLRNDQAYSLIPTLIIYLRLLDLANTDEFAFSTQSFPEMLSLYYTGVVKDPKVNIRLRSALNTIADRYRLDLDHIKCVWGFAKKLFESLQDLHSLGKLEMQVLETASMLSDVGQYVSDDIAENSYYIIRSIKVPGVDSKIMAMAACVAYESNVYFKKQLDAYVTLNTTEILTVSKLAAINRIARALDAGREGHIRDITIDISDRVLVNAIAAREPYIEIYEFDRYQQYFTETFGVYIELRVKVQYE